MNIDQAKRLLRIGHKLRHDYFSDDEWIQEIDGVIISEDGVKHDNFWGLRQHPGWNNEWRLYEDWRLNG